MSDYIERLEKAAVGLEDLTSDPASAIVYAYGMGGRMAFAQDLRSLLSDVGRMREALGQFDAAYGACPFSPSKRFAPDRRKPCTACGASQRESCGAFVGAAYAFITAARQALSIAGGEEDQEAALGSRASALHGRATNTGVKLEGE